MTPGTGLLSGSAWVDSLETLRLPGSVPWWKGDGTAFAALLAVSHSPCHCPCIPGIPVAERLCSPGITPLTYGPSR